MAKARFTIGGVGSVALAALLAVNPLGLEFDGDKGFRLDLAKAHARGGDDDRGGDRDDSDHGGGDDDSDHGGRDDDSDHGGRDDDSDRGGRDDDHGDRDDDDHGRAGKDGRDDDRGRGRGRGRGGDDHRRAAEEHRRGDDRRGGRRTEAGTGSGGVQVTKVEESAWGIEVEYSNGAKEEIENGQYERKDAFGRTVLERPASAADFDRIRSNVINSGLDLSRPAAGDSGRPSAQLPPDAQARRIERAGSAIEVSYRDGWKEEIEGGRYQLKDPDNRTVVERQATQADHDRLMALAGR